MIISHAHKFIFLHARKCAGSSVTAYLNPLLGPDDIQIRELISQLHAKEYEYGLASSATLFEGL
jgi:hypothetical protein